MSKLCLLILLKTFHLTCFIFFPLKKKKNPRITSIKPGKGPKSGGTTLEIWGLHMDAGSEAEAFVGGLPCNVTR